MAANNFIAIAGDVSTNRKNSLRSNTVTVMFGFGGHRGAPASSVKQRHLAEKVIDAERNVPGGFGHPRLVVLGFAHDRELRLRTVRS